MVLHIVKRKGHRERFDERKVYASCYAACLSAHMHKLKAEKVCEAVCRDVRKWIAGKKAVSSHEIFGYVAGSLRTQDEDAAFMYATHRDLS